MSIAILAVACAFAGRPEPSPPPVDDQSIAFARRIVSFYGTLRGRPLEAFQTFQDAKLRAYFASPEAFSDWYAPVANRVRDSHLRFGTPEEVRIRAFRFVDADTAQVDVVLVGPHERPLRFGPVEVELTDVWRRSEDGIWMLTPDRL